MSDHLFLGGGFSDPRKVSPMPNSDQAAAVRPYTDFAERMSYGDYLHLDSILSAQDPVSDSHDEMLFIIIHQATELWMKLMIHELEAAIACLRQDTLKPAFKMLARVSRIQAQLIQSWDVLSTLTPSDYLTFRDDLGQSSGFQSYQYRLIEFLLGNKNPAMMQPHTHRADLHGRLAAALGAPGLYDEALALLARHGHAIPQDRLERDWTQPYRESPGVERAWLAIYADTTAHWELYQLAEKLVDLEDWFQQWRFRHLTTVERIIGRKRGTGGTSGVDFLANRLKIRFFPELWQVRTGL